MTVQRAPHASDATGRLINMAMLVGVVVSPIGALVLDGAVGTIVWILGLRVVVGGRDVPPSLAG